LIGRHSAMNLAKSLIVSEKNYLNHRAPMQWIGSFWPEISPNFAFRQASLIRYSRKKACCSILLKESNHRPDRVCIGCTVNNLLKLWVCKLSFLKRHPSIQKSEKCEILRTYRGEKRKIPFRWVHPASLIRLLRDEVSSELKPKYGIELPTSIKICLVVSVVNLGEN
jgi:hypothetical protein